MSTGSGAKQKRRTVFGSPLFHFMKMPVQTTPMGHAIKDGANKGSALSLKLASEEDHTQRLGYARRLLLTLDLNGMNLRHQQAVSRFFFQRFQDNPVADF